jgi:hypothetical protein
MGASVALGRGGGGIAVSVGAGIRVNVGRGVRVGVGAETGSKSHAAIKLLSNPISSRFLTWLNLSSKTR